MEEERENRKRKSDDCLNPDAAKAIKFDNSPAGFKAAVMTGNYKEVKRLLGLSNINPADYQNFAIRYSAEFGFTDIVNLLLADSRVDPAQDTVEYDNVLCPILLAVKNGHDHIVQLLLSDKRVDPAFEAAYAKSIDIEPLLKVSLDYKHEKIAILLLSDPRIKFSDVDYLLHRAIRNRHDKLVKYLLSHRDSDELIPDQNDFLDDAEDQGIDEDFFDYTFKIAIDAEIGENEFKILKLLLADSRLDPAVGDNFSLKYSCEINKPKAVELLLADDRISLAKDDYYSDNAFPTIEAACISSNPKVVSLILSHHTIDVEKSLKFSLPYSAKNCNMEVLKCLLSFSNNRLNKECLMLIRNQCVNILSCRLRHNSNFDQYMVSYSLIDSKEIPYSYIDFLGLKSITLLYHLPPNVEYKIWAYVKHNSTNIEIIDLTDNILKIVNENKIGILDVFQNILNKKSPNNLKLLLLIKSTYFKSEKKKLNSIYAELFSKKYSNCVFFKQASTANEYNNPLPELLMRTTDIVNLILAISIKLIQNDIDEAEKIQFEKGPIRL